MTSDERAKRIEEAAEYLIRLIDHHTSETAATHNIYIPPSTLDALRAALTLEPAPPTGCFRCGHAQIPGYLLLSGKGNALVPCPYCNPGKAVEWMADAAHDPAPPREGTFACPICGLDEPHPHPAEVVAQFRFQKALDHEALHKPAPPPAPSEGPQFYCRECGHPWSSHAATGCCASSLLGGNCPCSATRPSTPAPSEECGACGGWGVLPKLPPGAVNPLSVQPEPCDSCGGTGRATKGEAP